MAVDINILIKFLFVQKLTVEAAPMRMTTSEHTTDRLHVCHHDDMVRIYWSFFWDEELSLD